MGIRFFRTQPEPSAQALGVVLVHVEAGQLCALQDAAEEGVGHGVGRGEGLDIEACSLAETGGEDECEDRARDRMSSLGGAVWPSVRGRA